MMRTLLLLCAGLLLHAAPAQAVWREASTDHFVIYSEADADDLTEFATRLERYDAVMRLLNNVSPHTPPPATRVTVYQVSGLGAVRRLHRGPQSAAGFYIPRAEGSIAIVPRRSGGGKFDLNAEIILFHEYAHHFLFQNFPSAYPGWFIEGFAEFNSTMSFEKDGSINIGMPAMHRATTFANSKVMEQMPTSKMLGASYGRLDAQEISALYARGWMLTHYLTFSEERRGQLATYLREMASGKTSPEAASIAFGDIRKLAVDLSRYERASTAPIVNMKGDRVKIGPISLRDLSAAEAAMMDVRIRSRSGVDRKEALALLPEARRIGALFPSDPFVQGALAEAEYDTGNYAEAEAATDRALATDPKWMDALTYKGMALMAVALKDEKTDEESWREIRRWFAAANRADPDDPEPLIRYYNSFRAAKQSPTPNAVLGLYQAFALAPQDGGLRLTAARQYLREGKTVEARNALIPIAFNPHGGPWTEMLSAVIATLDSTGPEAALEAWEKETERLRAEQNEGS